MTEALPPPLVPADVDLRDLCVNLNKGVRA